MAMTKPSPFDEEIACHDAALAARGLAIWVGSEPTFTDRHAQTPEWLSAALGGEKEACARRLLSTLCRHAPGALALRTEGRRYAGEADPRWNLGLYQRRDGVAIWNGPPDPLLCGPDARNGAAAPDLQAWADAVSASLSEGGLPQPERSSDDKRPGCVKLAAVLPDGSAAVFVLDIAQTGTSSAARIELPSCSGVTDFQALLARIEAAAHRCGLDALVIAGSSPPVDASVEWTTVTPDPAVIEINTAPSASATEFLRRSREMYAAAAEQGLAPYRLHFNGAVADSGGGGQITLGGPTPMTSPFIAVPGLLPRLVCFFNRHPCLSYNYSHDFVGSSGQSARADERHADAVGELSLALHLLARQAQPGPEMLWRSLAPFLCDAIGNSHRAELNIEKLWNPYLGSRGVQGLVEFRALRMQQTPERAAALACLLRAIVAMLAGTRDELPLVDWGAELHERHALPYYLEQDLLEVLAALDAAGLGFGPAMRTVLLREEFRRSGQVDLPGCTLEIRRALEFWPLVGDASSPDQAGASRLVDSSTARVELRLRQHSGADAGGWEVRVAGHVLPMRQEHDALGPLGVYGLRYRSFTPQQGLHPGLQSQAPLRFRLRHPAQAEDQLVTLHDWRPDGGAYDGLPADLDDARERRAARVTMQGVPRDQPAPSGAAPAVRPGPYAFDLRWLAEAIPA